MPFDPVLVCLPPTATIREAIATIDRNQRGIVLVTDAERHLLGTITDGDIRRAILHGSTLETAVTAILQMKARVSPTAPVTAAIPTERAQLLHLMQTHRVHQIPLLDGEGKVGGLVTMDDLVPNHAAPTQAVIMAGGFGRRLYPLTETVPKPMLQVGDRPIMERLIGQLREAGIQRVSVTTHFQPEKITEYFGDGEAFGVQLHYVTEERPLGTAGALSLLEASTEPLLVVNGDVLTGTDFRALLAYHREHRADLTVAVRQYDMTVPYGVIECEGERVTNVREKPVTTVFVNAGIYLLEPGAHRAIPTGERFDMTDLIHRLLAAGRCVISFPILEYWLDIGQQADFRQAQEDLRNGKVGQERIT